MPSFGDVVGVVEDDESLDLPAGEEGDGCDSGLPTQHAKPATGTRLVISLVDILGEAYTR